MAYRIEFGKSLKAHFRHLTADQRTRALDIIEKRLVYEPFAQNRNRKLLRPNPIAPWELRLGEIRVFYDSAPDEKNTVRILAVGYKKSGQLFIAGKIVEL